MVDITPKELRSGRLQAEAVPGPVRRALAGGRHPGLRVHPGRQLAHAGRAGMDRKELASRLLLEALAASLLVAARWCLARWVTASAILTSALALTLSFTLNGQVWVCVRCCPFYARDPAAVARFAHALVEYLRCLPWLEQAAIIGSR